MNRKGVSLYDVLIIFLVIIILVACLIVMNMYVKWKMQDRADMEEAAAFQASLDYWYMNMLIKEINKEPVSTAANLYGVLLPIRTEERYRDLQSYAESRLIDFAKGTRGIKPSDAPRPPGYMEYGNWKIVADTFNPPCGGPGEFWEYAFAGEYPTLHCMNGHLAHYETPKGGDEKEWQPYALFEGIDKDIVGTYSRKSFLLTDDKQVVQANTRIGIST